MGAVICRKCDIRAKGRSCPRFTPDAKAFRLWTPAQPCAVWIPQGSSFPLTLTQRTAALDWQSGQPPRYPEIVTLGVLRLLSPPAQAGNLAARPMRNVTYQP